MGSTAYEKFQIGENVFKEIMTDKPSDRHSQAPTHTHVHALTPAHLHTSSRV